METGSEGFAPGYGSNRSQPTYKEWKRQIQKGVNYHDGPVPSLPTRNGNKDLDMNKREDLSKNVPSLPTRNGNVRVLFYPAGVEVEVPSLPTRNGNIA